MGWVKFQPNPFSLEDEGDCTVRMLCCVLKCDWDTAYLTLVTEGFEMKRMPSSNLVWPNILLKNGYVERSLFRRCRECYTVEDFCRDHPEGSYVLCSGSHVLYVQSGDYYDSWQSGKVTPIYYFEKVSDGEQNQVIKNV